jgi:dipeptidyl aminopeptidase/acylaminoacyl peptidase
LSSDGTYCALAHSEHIGNQEAWNILLLDTASGELIHKWPINVGHAYALFVEKEGNSFRILIQTNARGFEESAWLTTNTNDVQYSGEVPTHDAYPLAYDTESSRLAVCAVRNGSHTLTLVNGKKDSRQIGLKNGSYDIYFGGATFLDSSRLITRWQSGVHTPGIIEIDLVGNKISHHGIVKSGAVNNTPLQSVECNASDGSTIQAWVALPKNTTGPVPFAIYLHGGPDSVTLDAFSAEAQAWVDNGIGYCGLNYHGSISFGKKFQEAIIGKPGTLEVEDSVAMKNELVRRGWATENQCILTGYSWGGFVTLLGLGKTPTE